MVESQVLSAFGLDKQLLQLADGSELALQSVVRVLPKRRLVCKALWKGRLVYTKFFIGARAALHAKRDADGALALTAAGIATPTLLYQQIDHIFCMLVYEAIAPSENLADVWQRLDQKSRLALAHNIVRTAAQHHHANILQSDMHLKNFLLKEDTIYTLDGDGIRRFLPLNNKLALDNLSALFSMFDVLDISRWLKQLIETYQQASADSRTLEINDINRSVSKHRKRLSTQYAEKKVFRQCTDVNVSRNFCQLTAIASQFSCLHIPQDMRSLDDLVDNQTRLKSGNTCTVSLVNIDDVAIAIKRYNIKNIVHRSNRLFRQTRASVSWANAHRLRLLGLPTAKPIALIETRCLGLRGKAYFLSEYIHAPSVAEFFSNTKDKAIRAQTAKLIAQLFYRLYLLDISHGDMKATNMKILDNKPILIDLDSMRQHKRIQPVTHGQDILRFMQNWKDQPLLYNAFVKVFKVVYADHAPLRIAQILD